MTLRSLLPTHYKNKQPLTAKGLNDPVSTLQSEINRVFDQMFSTFDLQSTRFVDSDFVDPKLDVKEKKGRYEITVELPGVDESDIDVQLSDNNLIIRGEKTSESDENDEKGYRVQERSYGSFLRTVPLGYAPDMDAVDAVFKKGILKVTIPVPDDEVLETKRISINS